ncbi:AraC family transcriptional regulator [Mesorhizobium sp. B2-3-4]|uniref:AraC family transcriptional regulator n=1 Tax=Mesorhizobium sp. B2-3-4 TaxID=2589959 RepID=UPI001127894D|nr:AraC family transcriptional regulator [Mesorhizobium sp. B2-3-4]TPM30921.1 AraC family transcriptional regulator [Mesorhizobium sp. B2-3-4]
MIENLISGRKHDRLTAFMQAFGLRAVVTDRLEADANLFLVSREEEADASYVVFRAAGGAPSDPTFSVLVAARIDFGGIDNPLVGALPEELVLALAEHPRMRGLADALMMETENASCGGRTVQERLCEIIVVLAVRRAIDMGRVGAGLLAGLAHPTLHPCLVAVHDRPAFGWRTETLAQLAGLSRGHFIAQFTGVVGTTPAAYVTAWRLALGRAEIAAGHSVKAVAHRVGFGSAAAFSRAFSRSYGYPPAETPKARSPR